MNYFKALAIYGLLLNNTPLAKCQVDASSLLTEVKMEPDSNRMPFYKPGEDKLRLELVKAMQIPYQQPHYALLTIDKKGLVKKAEIKCPKVTCDFHATLANKLLQSQGWVAGIYKNKPVTVTNFTLTLDVDTEEPDVIAPPETSQPVAPPTGPEIYTIVEEQAEFPGGLEKMKEYLDEKAKLPKACRETVTTSCKVFIRCIVDENGKMIDAAVLKGCVGCNGADAVAKAAVLDMPTWKPAKMHGRAVKCYYMLPVVFANQK